MIAFGNHPERSEGYSFENLSNPYQNDRLKILTKRHLLNWSL